MCFCANTTMGDLAVHTLTHPCNSVRISTRATLRTTFSIVSLGECLTISACSQLVLLLWLRGWTALGSPCEEAAGTGRASACTLHWDPSNCDSRKAPRGKTGVWVGKPAIIGKLGAPTSHELTFFTPAGWNLGEQLCMECREQSKRLICWHLSCLSDVCCVASVLIQCGFHSHCLLS